MSFDEVRNAQEGIITHAQAIAAGLTPAAIRARLSSGRWRTLLRGVYATFTGPVSYRAAVFAALLAAGPGAVASHSTAATLWGSQMRIGGQST